MIQQRLLEILVCPQCKGPVHHETEPREELICRACRLAYPVTDGIPDMIVDDARRLDEGPGPRRG